LVQQRLARQQAELARPQRLLAQQQAKQQHLQQIQLQLRVQLAQAAQALKKPISPTKQQQLQRQVQSWQQRYHASNTNWRPANG